MINDSIIEMWFSSIPVSEFSGLEAKHMYAMAEIAYKAGFEDAVMEQMVNDNARRCENCSRQGCTEWLLLIDSDENEQLKQLTYCSAFEPKDKQT